MPVSLAIALVVGGVIGLSNGLLVVKLKMNAFIVTLASYLPLYWYRKNVEDKRDVGVPTGAIPSPGD